MPGRTTRDERVRALGAARGLAVGLAGEAGDRERAGLEHAAVVEEQRRRDAVAAPGLSRAGWAAVRAAEAARGEGTSPGPRRGLGMTR